MNLFSLVGRMTAAKYAAVKAGGAAKPFRSPAPLGLCQGAMVEISPVPVLLAQAAGAILPEVAPNQTVVSVGVMRLFGQRIVRSYLSDGRSFIETVADGPDGAASKQTRLYTLHTERTPGTPEEWEFLLGGPAKTRREDATGEEVVVQEATPPLIGWPLFQIDDPVRGQVLFERSWPADQPQEAEEIVTDAAGHAFRARHMLMQYARRVGDVAEHLLAEAIETEEGAVFDAALGLDLGAAELSVLPPA